MGIEYNYSVDKLDDLVSKIYEQGLSPIMTDDLRAEVELRYQELMHPDVDEDDPDYEDFRSAKQKHEDAMRNIEAQRRKSHSRNVMIIELTDEQKAEIRASVSTAYVRSNPNSEYHIPDSVLNEDAERARVMKQLQSLGKVYYHQEDFRNAIRIITNAIEFSLRNDYPWMTYEEARKEYEAGRIKFTYMTLPRLLIDYNTEISDPAVLKGVVTGEINLIDKDQEPVKKKKVKSNPVVMPYTVITPQEHEQMARIHQMGYNTDISTILKSCSTIYNRYVIPTSFTAALKRGKETPQIDWMRPDAGQLYFDALHDVKHNPTTDVISLLNAHNDRKLNHVIGSSLREFPDRFKPEEPKSFKTISTTLEQNQEAVAIESKLLNLIRQTNPNV